MTTLALAEADGERYLKALDAKDIAAARAVPASNLLKAGGRWWPNFDGSVLLGDQYGLYEAGKFNDTPVLIGTNSDEGAMFTRNGVTSDAFTARIRGGYGDHAESILDAYPHATSAEAFKASKDIFRDSAFAWHTWTWARLQSQNGKGKAYLYYFDHRTPQSAGGANHGAEIAYVFGNLDLPGRTPQPNDEAMSELMRNYWVNFARTGDPNGPDLAEWPAFTAVNERVMQFDSIASVRPTPNLRQLKVLDAYYSWRREQAKKEKTGTSHESGRPPG
jgi:para-nitrobenzyl esterase